MKKLKIKKRFNERYLLRLMTIVMLALVGCSSDDGDDLLGNWIDRSVFDGTPRSSSVAFNIGNKGYVGTGYDGDDYLNDFWVYDMEGNFWSQLSDFPGIPRSSAVAFNVGNEAFVGLGFDGDDELKDFFKYDINTNIWSPVSEFAGTPRRGAVAFNSGTAGYVGTGFDGDNDKKDFWKYNPSTDTWTEIVGFGGNKRRDAATFTIGNNLYLGTGISNGLLQTDFWVFDMTTETWSELLDLDDDDDYNILRTGAVGFTIGGRGYFACGDTGAGAIRTVWEYDPTRDEWDEKTNFEGIQREDAVALYNGERAFVALGRTGNLYLDDNLEFFPFDEEDEDD
ncbi:Kelch repeat-containing protein [Flavobacteriaceae bacterium M23B6Z8]